MGGAGRGAVVAGAERGEVAPAAAAGEGVREAGGAAAKGGRRPQTAVRAAAR